MKYLKQLSPEKYGHYNSYFSVFTLKKYNTKLQFLLVPCFNRYRNNEDENSAHLAKWIRLYQYISILLFTLLILPILIAVLID